MRHAIVRVPLVLASVSAGWLLAGPGARAEEPVAMPKDLFAQPVQPAVMPTSPDDPIVTVGGTTITRAEVERELANAMRMMGGRVPAEQAEQVRGQLTAKVVENLVNRALLLQAASAEGIAVTPEEVEAAHKQLAGQVPEGQDLDTLLAAQGMDPAQLDANIATDMRVAKLIEMKTAGVEPPSAEEIAAIYEKEKERFQVPESAHARHVLIAVPSDASPEAKAEKRAAAEALQKQLAEGADFAEVAAAHSDCPSKTRGGDLGRFPRGQMVKPFEEAAFSQETGVVGPVVETPFGFHVIEVLERDEARALALEEVEQRIGQVLTNQRKQLALQTYLNELREKTPPVRP